jgi:hypothetical protein
VTRTGTQGTPTDLWITCEVVRPTVSVLVTVLVRPRTTLATMAKSWDLRLAVDAVGSDSCRVRMRRLSPDGSHAHLVVGAGPVMVYVLDPKALTDLASAWAAAHVRGAHLLPIELPVARRARSTGAAYPLAQVVVEGRQHWNARPPQPGQAHLLVTAGWLNVRVHDRVALDTQVRAWAEASAFGAKLFGRNRTPSFDHLLEQAQIAAVKEAARRDDHRLDRRGVSRER